MLRKLLKYEFKATGRIFLPLYGALLLIAAIERLFLNFNLHNVDSLALDMLSLTVPTIFAVLFCAVCVVTFVMMIQRFYKNLLGREGYLMFTLPVSTAKLIWSKVIVVMVWTVLSIIAAMLAFVIVFLDTHTLRNMAAYFVQSMRMLGDNSVWIMLQVLLLLIVCAVAAILVIYLSMAIGQLVNKHRVLASIGAYIGINIILNNLVFSIIAQVGFSTMGRTLYGTFFVRLNDYQAVSLTLWIYIAFFLIQAAVCFLLTRYILSKKLNLE